MRTLKTMMMIFVLSSMSLTISCSSDDDSSSSGTAATIAAIETNMESGSWRITYYFDSDHEETDHFNSYVFVFEDDGTLTASNAASTHTGAWSVTNSNSRTTDDDVDFNIAFSTPADFVELTDDWDIITYNSNRIELIDVSGGGGGTDYLTFEKN